MGTIETFDHTADVGLRVTGTSVADLFTTAAEGLFDYVVANRSAVRVDRVEEVELAAESTADLLVAWLNELIYRLETRHVLYAEFAPTVRPDGLALSARIGGEAIDRTRHVLDHEVKAVTHHALSVDHDDQGRWTAEVILDI